MQHQDEVTRAALDAVAHACKLARSVQQNLEQVREITKDDRSPVTVADFAVQAIIALELRRSLGEDVKIVGEEHAGVLREDANSAVREAVIGSVQLLHPNTSADTILNAIDQCDHDGSAASYWTLDPVDGTKGFLRGQQYAIALALIEHGEVKLGVMGCPNLPMNQSMPLDEADRRGTIYAAAAGFGTWEYDADDVHGTPNRIKILPEGPGEPLRVCESVEAAHSDQSGTAKLMERLGGAGEPARLDSQAKYAVVARGQADAYLRLPTSTTYVEKIWDHAAGSLIATEAGAVVSDVAGNALDFTHGRLLSANRGVICAVAHWHGRIIDAIRELKIAG
jgi:3'(2'), 5'-bisphosphate nucleotidase